MTRPFKLSSDIIGDMGVGLIRYECGRMGHIFRELPTQDHGIDAVIEIGDDDGGHTGKLIAVQIKCGESFWRGENRGSIWFEFNNRQSEYWDNHILPVICVIAHPFDKRCIWQVVSGTEKTSAGINKKIAVKLDQRFDGTARHELEKIASRAYSDTNKVASKKTVTEHDNLVTVFVEILLQDELNDADCEQELLSQVYAHMWSKPQVPSYTEGSRMKQISKVIVRAFRNEAERLQNIPRSEAKFHPFEDGVEPSYWHNENLELEVFNHREDIESIKRHSEYWSDPESGALNLIYKHFYRNLTDRNSTAEADVDNCSIAISNVLAQLCALPDPPLSPPAFIRRGVEFHEALKVAQGICEEGRFPINQLQEAERAYLYATYELKKK